MPVASRCFAAVKAAVVEVFGEAAVSALAVQRGEAAEDPESGSSQTKAHWPRIL